MSLRLGAALSLAGLLALSACGLSDPPPEDTVKAFFAESWDEGETAEDYLADVEPYLTEAALEDSSEVFSGGLNGPATVKYSQVTIDDVQKVSDSEAQVTVSYTVTYSYRDTTESQDETDTLTLEKVEGKWLLSE